MRCHAVFGLYCIALPMLYHAGNQALAQEVFVDKLFSVSVTSNIVYGQATITAPSAGMKNLLLDIYQPTGAGVPTLKPGFVMVHGGGWVQGSKTDLTTYATEFAKRGYVCVSIDYRLYMDRPPGNGVITETATILQALEYLFRPLTPQEKIDAIKTVESASEDVRTAVSWLKSNAADYGVDPERIALGGTSAGGISSLVAAYLLGADAKGVWANTSSLAGNEVSVVSTDIPEVAFGGTEDPIVPIQTMRNLDVHLDGLGVRSDLYEMAGRGHDLFRTEILSSGFSVEQTIALFMHDELDLDHIHDRWVDFAHTGVEQGSKTWPFNSLTEGVASVAAGKTVYIKGNTGDNTTYEPQRITKAMRLLATGGPVRIGVLGGKYSR